MPDTMLAVVKPQAKPGIEIRDVALPKIGRTDVLVKVKVASICGTDLHIYNWNSWAQGRIHPPLIPGRSHQRQGGRLRFGRNARGLRQVSAMPHR